MTFSFTVATSGDYTATLRAFGQTSTETGTVRLSGSTILFSVRTPVAGTSQGTWSRAGAQLILESDLFLDFNQDGTAEDLSTRFVLSSP